MIADVECLKYEDRSEISCVNVAMLRPRSKASDKSDTLQAVNYKCRPYPRVPTRDQVSQLKWSELSVQVLARYTGEGFITVLLVSHFVRQVAAGRKEAGTQDLPDLLL